MNALLPRLSSAWVTKGTNLEIDIDNNLINLAVVHEFRDYRQVVHAQSAPKVCLPKQLQIININYQQK